MKIIVYRNYNCPANQLIEKTGYEKDSENLKQFLSGINVNGGWGDKALEVCYKEINKDEKVDQVILIGDTASNTRF